MWNEIPRNPTSPQAAPLRVAIWMDRFGVGGTEIQMALLTQKCPPERAEFLVLGMGGDADGRGLFSGHCQVEQIPRRFRFDLTVVGRVLNRCDDWGADVILAPHRFSGFLAKMARLRYPRLNVVVALRGKRKLGILRRLLYDWLDEALLPMAQVVLTNAAPEAERLRRNRRISDSVVLVNNAVLDPELRSAESLRRDWSIPAGVPVVGTVGRLAPIKNLDTGIKAIRCCLAEVSDIRWVVVGDGPERKRLQSEVSSAGLDGKVIWLGQRTDAAELLAGFDVLLHPSSWEHSSNAILEAMAASVPVVAFDVGGNPDLVGESGRRQLAPVGDYDALGHQLARLLGDERLRHDLAADARALVRERNTPEKLVDEHLTALERASGRTL